MAELWDGWIPGVLSHKQLADMCASGDLEGATETAKLIDYSSIDLHLSDEAYVLASGSVKPSGGRYLTNLLGEKLAVLMQPTGGSFVLDARKTYLFKLRERIAYPGKLAAASFHAQATAKSSIGRLDVLARLIVDGADVYEGFAPSALRDSNGALFVEVTPMTFAIKVKAGVSLTQLRLFLGAPEEVEVRGAAIAQAALHGQSSPQSTLSVDLTNTAVVDQMGVAFRSKAKQELPLDPIDLSAPADKRPSPEKYWDVVPSSENRRLPIMPDSFYILRSLESITVPKGIAVYCRATDETIGEMRIHYAGFVHPYFGLDRSDGTQGTPLIFEVRGHDVEVNLAHGEKMARLIFYRLSEDAEMHGPSEYSDQTLRLSKHFGPWPVPQSKKA